MGTLFWTIVEFLNHSHMLLWQELTRCPTLCETAQHFCLLSHVPHIEKMSNILISSSFEKSTLCWTDVFLKSGFYPMTVKKLRGLSSWGCVIVQTALTWVKCRLSCPCMCYPTQNKVTSCADLGRIHGN